MSMHCKKSAKMAEWELNYLLYTTVDKCTPGMTSGTLDINLFGLSGCIEYF